MMILIFQETKGRLEGMLKRINVNEFDPKTLHCNSLIKTVKNQRYFLNDSFEEILNLSDIWINEGSE